MKYGCFLLYCDIMHKSEPNLLKPCRLREAAKNDGVCRREKKMTKKYRVTQRVISAGEHEMKLLILQPAVTDERKEKTPGILWIHGGGYAVGMAGMVFMSRALRLVTEYGAVVVSPEYRLAGKVPYPAAAEDCYAALRYLKMHAEELGCAADQIMVGGERLRGSENRISDAAVSDAGLHGHRFIP